MGFLDKLQAYRAETGLDQALEPARARQKQLSPMEKLSLATMGIPIVGDVIGVAADLQRMYQNPEERTATNVGLTAAGALPFIPSGLGKIKTVPPEIAREIEFSKLPKEQQVARLYEDSTARQARAAAAQAAAKKAGQLQFQKGTSAPNIAKSGSVSYWVNPNSRWEKVDRTHESYAQERWGATDLDAAFQTGAVRVVDSPNGISIQWGKGGKALEEAQDWVMMYGGDRRYILEGPGEKFLVTDSADAALKFMQRTK